MNECDCLSAKFNRADSFSASIVSYKAVSAALEKADETTAIIMHVKNTHSGFTYEETNELKPTEEQ
jgi:hypothetical protein